jgi:hypothetical protein
MIPMLDADKLPLKGSVLRNLPKGGVLRSGGL